MSIQAELKTLNATCKQLLAQAKANGDQLVRLNDTGQAVLEELKSFHECVCPKVVGIGAEWSEPEPRPEEKGKIMATVKLVKKSHLKMAGAPKQLAKGAKVDTFVLLDNEDATATIMGEDAAHQTVDISAVATLAAVSDNTGVLTLDAPVGMTVQAHGVAPGNAKVTFTATWNDGSIGPFSLEDPVTVQAGGPTGLSVTWGTPVVRP